MNKLFLGTVEFKHVFTSLYCSTTPPPPPPFHFSRFELYAFYVSNISEEKKFLYLFVYLCTFYFIGYYLFYSEK